MKIPKLTLVHVNLGSPIPHQAGVHGVVLFPYKKPFFFLEMKPSGIMIQDHAFRSHTDEMLFLF